MGKVHNYTIDILLLATITIVASVLGSLGLFADYALWVLLVLDLSIIAICLRYIPVQKIASHSIDLDRFSLDHKKDMYYPIKRFLLINRQYIFPTVLVIYLVYLLIKQTGLRGLEDSVFVLLLNIYEGNIILFAVIISGIATVFQEDKQEKYLVKTQSLLQGKLHLGLTVVLSLLGLYIVFIQTASLGWISYVISMISGVLLFLIGVMIMEEDEEVVI